MKKPLVVILAGGIGKRFAPLTINKTLIPFFGKPLLQHMLEMIEEAGFRHAIIATNFENEEWFGTYQPSKLTIETKLQNEPLGMGDALLNLEREIDNRPILVMNAVDFIDPLFFKTLLDEAYNHYAYITGMRVHSHFPGGYLKLQGEQVIEIVEKPAKGTEPSNMVNLVFHYFSQPQDFMLLLKKTKTDADDHYERALSELMKVKTVGCIPYNGYWQKLKFSHNVLDMMELFLKHKIRSYKAHSAYVSKHAIIEGDVYLDDNCRIEDFAIVKGPAYIGRGAVVGNQSLVRQSIIEEKTIIGFGSEIARSYIGPNCMLHHNFIGDSVFESNINPSYGTTTANLRIDGKEISLKLPDVQIETTRTKLGTIAAKGVFSGINCSFMPGVTLGENARIFPGSIVFDAVEAEEVLKK